MSEPIAPRKQSDNPRGDRRRAVVIVQNKDGVELVSPRAQEPVTPRSSVAGNGSLAPTLAPYSRASRSGSLSLTPRNRSDSFAVAMKNLVATASPQNDRPLTFSDGREAESSGPVVGAPFQAPRADRSLSTSDGFRSAQILMMSTIESRLEVTFLFPDGQQMTETIPTLVTLDQVRDYLLRSAAASGSLPQPFGLKAAFTDHYFSGGDMLRSIKELPYIVFCMRHNIPVRIAVVGVELQTKEQRHFMTVQRLLGRQFPWTFDDLEAFAFRSHFYQQLSTREPPPISCEARTTNSLMTLLPSTFIVQVSTTLPEFRQRSSCINANRGYTAADVVRDFCRRNTSANLDGVLIRVAGRQEYIFDDRQPLINVVYVRECLKRRQRIFFELVSRAQHSPAPVSPRHDVSYEAPPQLPAVWEPLWDKHDPVSFRVANCEIADLTALDASLKGNYKLFVDVHISNAGSQLASSRTRHMPPSTSSDGSTSPRRRQTNVLWDDTLNCSLSLSSLPRTARLTVVLMARPDGKRTELTLASGHLSLFDWRGIFLSGHCPLRLIAGKTVDLMAPLLSSSEEVPAAKVNLFLPTPEKPLLFPRHIPPAPLFPAPQPSPEDCKQLEALLASDPLYEFDPQEASLVWRYRDYCKSVSGSLIKILACVPWTERLAAQDIYRKLDTLPALDPRDALGLLDRRLVDPRVRAYAVRCLRRLPDNELEDLLLQMIQVLRYEPYHFSALACFLLERAHKNRIQIGASFYWHAKSELDSASPGGAFRYLLMLDAYLRGCGSEMDELLAEAEVVGLLRTCALHSKDAQPAARRDSLQAELGTLKLPAAFRLPLLPTIQCTGLRIAKCKTMDSAKVPLWLVFENSNAEAEDTFLIFKEGDDLRQDMLTLQILNVMDRLWQSDGLDLHLTLYRCIATGHMSGMIQVVLDSQTIANIQGTAGGAFDKRALDRWLREKNTTEEEYLLAVENFIYSCAGYCVATYVLGVGDRHNDNIMLSTNGHLFHIDFGHFLGNFKKFLGLKRENVPFVFTPEFAYIMGGEKHANFARFVDLCCQAFAVLRRHSNFFINLFAMMLSTGMPELKTADDLGYLKRAFMLDGDESRAMAAFKKLIFASMNDSRRRLDNAIHILAHK